MKKGDRIKHRGAKKRVWTITYVHKDGWLDVESRSYGRLVRRVIKRPEGYIVVASKES